MFGYDDERYGWFVDRNAECDALSRGFPTAQGENVRYLAQSTVSNAPQKQICLVLQLIPRHSAA